ncbi:hypothetical protein H113_02661 [Trichophyton rubrum MR1459]|uniref:Uncharacterized protein n=1 Tax=Trichophyton rubrum (strain ATCC MYA-4607 / CBS 118892) TaxID=559305 RepID=A0A080WPN7_TRIRC|nr:uncharacterized protein TERG_12401 [Trichophyton rubrum CBS 118892]EZF97347.1 hypothetical protein H113_02661 [Trichophyton rubrum MR1459]EZG08340.1 hypothetical protein H106_02514 [Trichophyton rubrum CBS 735.88]KFL62310.1 hypothetical protein TERG_12401 [Trichophyton rubrum CBS 118892]
MTDGPCPCTAGTRERFFTFIVALGEIGGVIGSSGFSPALAEDEKTVDASVETVYSLSVHVLEVSSEFLDFRKSTTRRLCFLEGRALGWRPALVVRALYPLSGEPRDALLIDDSCKDCRDAA